MESLYDSSALYDEVVEVLAAPKQSVSSHASTHKAAMRKAGNAAAAKRKRKPAQCNTQSNHSLVSLAALLASTIPQRITKSSTHFPQELAYQLYKVNEIAQDPQNTIRLIVDKRENPDMRAFWHKTCKLVEFHHLLVADYVIVCDGVVQVAVERKSLTDINSRTGKEESRQQRERLASVFQDRARVFYLTETWPHVNSHWKGWDAIFGSCINNIEKFDLQCVILPSVELSLIFLLKLVRKVASRELTATGVPFEALLDEKSAARLQAVAPSSAQEISTTSDAVDTKIQGRSSSSCTDNKEKKFVMRRQAWPSSPGGASSPSPPVNPEPRLNESKKRTQEEHTSNIHETKSNHGKKKRKIAETSTPPANTKQKSTVKRGDSVIGKHGDHVVRRGDVDSKRRSKERNEVQQLRKRATKSADTAKASFVKRLKTIHGIGNKTALAVQSHFKNDVEICSLIAKDRGNAIHTIASIQVSEKRMVGKVAATKIVDALC